MYKEFFGMANLPFSRKVPPEELYASQAMEECLGRMKYVSAEQLFAVVTSDPGCGKSTLIRRLIHELPGEGALLHGEEDPQAIWMWGTLAADFKLVGDVWKIWHLHYFRLMKCDYQKGWVKDTSLENKLNASMPRSARPTTYHNPYTPYTIRDCIPGIPHPYTSYEESDKDWMFHNEKAF